MKVKVKELQEAVNSIQVTDKMQEEMIRNIKAAVREKEENTAGAEIPYKSNGKDRRSRNNKRRKMPRAASIAAAVAAVIAISGVLSIPVRALVNSLIQERMEQVPAEEMDAIVEDSNSQQVGADSFTREYTEEEKIRLKELAAQYQAGTFPSGELFQAQSVEEAESRELCFLVTNGTFYLPDRELTDEELLEIIDFYAKREYALTKHAEEEFADEIAAQKEQEKQQIAEVVEAGGITEEEAIAIASDYLEKFFGITGDGLELNHYYEGDIVIADENEFYQVNWTDFPSRKHYYFYISAKDGSLVNVLYSGGELLADKTGPSVAEAEKLIPKIRQEAVSFIEEETQFVYEDVYVVYYAVNDILKSYLSFKFVQGDKAYVIVYTWDGVFIEFRKSTFSDHEQEYGELKENIISAETHNRGLKPEEAADLDIDLYFEITEP